MAAKSQETLITALDLKFLFNSPQLEVPSRRLRDAMIKPNEADIGRAVANIRVWRKYLPQDCVVAMIKDGWQWST
ncbi:MAG TPA: hypothetical protein VNZ02_06575 [Steroidobacteraceae bacterium]|jgi:hypothetical protein|nr:hypothetical protein [Steroidobacteraceae bacterium]